MDQVKSWLTSKTVWMSIIGFAVQAATVLHLSIPGIASMDTTALAGHLANLVSAVLFIAAGVFRVTATHKLA